MNTDQKQRELLSEKRIRDRIQQLTVPLSFFYQYLMETDGYHRDTEGWSFGHPEAPWVAKDYPHYTRPYIHFNRAQDMFTAIRGPMYLLSPVANDANRLDQFLQQQLPSAAITVPSPSSSTSSSSTLSIPNELVAILVDWHKHWKHLNRAVSTLERWVATWVLPVLSSQRQRHAIRTGQHEEDWKEAVRHNVNQLLHALQAESSEYKEWINVHRPSAIIAKHQSRLQPYMQSDQVQRAISALDRHMNETASRFDAMIQSLDARNTYFEAKPSY